VPELWTLGVMPLFITNSSRRLFVVLFFVFETLLISSAVALMRLDLHHEQIWGDAAAITFWFSFVGLFVVSFLLRRVARHLSMIGWFTLFLGFFSMILLPVT
jgi:hypothetical protein